MEVETEKGVVVEEQKEEKDEKLLEDLPSRAPNSTRLGWGPSPAY